MKRHPAFWPSVVLLIGIVGYTTAAVIPAIIPPAVPTANKRGNSTVFQLASSNAAGTSGALYCDDGSGNLTTAACTTANSVSSTTPVTVSANVTTDQQLMELSLSAGALNSIGQPFDFFGAGVFSLPVAQTPQLTFKVKLCTVSGCGSGTVVTLVSIQTVAAIANVTNNNWSFRVLAVTAATGASGNLEVHGPVTVDLGLLTTTADSVYGDTNTAVSSNINLAAALFVDWTIAFSTNSASNSMTQREGAVLPASRTGAGGGGASNGVFASKWITTSESESASCGGSFGSYTGFADLTTPDSVTFTLSGTSTVIINYFAQVAPPGGSSTHAMQAVIDASGTIQNAISITSGFAGLEFLTMSTSLAGGAHTVDIQHCGSGGSPNISNRLLQILISN